MMHSTKAPSGVAPLCCVLGHRDLQPRGNGHGCFHSMTLMRGVVVSFPHPHCPSSSWVLHQAYWSMMQRAFVGLLTTPMWQVVPTHVGLLPCCDSHAFAHAHQARRLCHPHDAVYRHQYMPMWMMGAVQALGHFHWNCCVVVELLLHASCLLH